MKSTPIQIEGGWQVTGFKLAGSQIRNITILGLDLDTNDIEVERYLSKFGAKLVQKDGKYYTFPQGNGEARKMATALTWLILVKSLPHWEPTIESIMKRYAFTTETVSQPVAGAPQHLISVQAVGTQRNAKNREEKEYF